MIIGIDGVPYNLMEDLSSRDIMPNFRRLRGEGVFTKMSSSIPEISSVSWSSIITGKNPGEHGVYGFTDMIEGAYTISFHSSRDLKAPTFWQKNGDKTCVVINVPSTYPAQKINGILISGFVSPDLEKAVYPPSYLEKLKNMNYRIDIDSEKAHKSKLLLFKELFETLETRIKVSKYLWEKVKWNIFMVVFTGSDRLEHFLWDAYEDENHEYHTKFLEFFKRVDMAIGRLNDKLGEDDSLIILSDHGMEGIKTNVNVNVHLAEEGFLKLGENPNKRYNNIGDETKAFALDPGRIYLNREERYPNGCVRKEEEDGIIEALIDSFDVLEMDGEKVLRKIYRGNEIYRGRYVGRAPDLVLMPNSGFNLMSGLSKKELFEESPLTGKHTQDDAFLFVKARGAKDIVPKNPSVEDVVSIMEGLQAGDKT
ncbi:MAG: alkaline phosphatase family protein [Candidatus Bathyarchaeia archaeon]